MKTVAVNPDVSYIGSKEAQGNYTGRRNYSFNDRKPLAGQILYRLKMINKNNAENYILKLTNIDGSVHSTSFITVK